MSRHLVVKETDCERRLCRRSTGWPPALAHFRHAVSGDVTLFRVVEEVIFKMTLVRRYVRGGFIDFKYKSMPPLVGQVPSLRVERCEDSADYFPFTQNPTDSCSRRLTDFRKDAGFLVVTVDLIWLSICGPIGVRCKRPCP